MSVPDEMRVLIEGATPYQRGLARAIAESVYKKIESNGEAQIEGEILVDSFDDLVFVNKFTTAFGKMLSLDAQETEAQP